MKKNSIRWEAGILAFFSTIAKALAFGKEMLLASFFGAGVILDIYYAGTAFSTFLLFFFSGGAFIPLIISFYTSSKGEKSKQLNAFLVSLLILSILLSILTVNFAELLTSGVRQDIRLQVIEVLKITAFGSVFYVVSSIMRAMLNSIEDYRLSGLQDLVMVVVIIIGIFMTRMGDPVLVLSWTFLASILARALVQLPPIVINRGRFQWRIVWKWSSLLSYYSNFLPLMLAIMIPQLFVAFTKNVGASLDSGALSALSFAERTSDLTRSIIATSLGAVLVTPFAKSIAKNNMEDFGRMLLKSLQYVFLLSIPIFFFFLLYGQEAISLLYQRGNFDSYAVRTAGTALSIYSLVALLGSATYIVTTAMYTMRSVSIFMKSSILSVLLGSLTIIYTFKMWGIYSVAIGMAVYTVLFFLISTHLTLKASKNSLLELWSRVRMVLYINFAAFLLGYMISLHINIAVGFLSTALIYLVLSHLLKEESFIQVFSLIRGRLKNR